MIYPRIALAITTTIAVVSCSPTGNPQLDMCQKITSNILTGDVEFGEIQETKGIREMQMVLPFTSDGNSSETICVFAKETSAGETYVSSPKDVTIDGMKIGSKDLMRASLASSKIVLKESADETKKQTAAAAEEAKQMANEAKDTATELAGEAKDKATELAADAKVKAGEVATQIQESEAVERAKELAGETTDKAKNALIEGAKAVQQKLEN